MRVELNKRYDTLVTKVIWPRFKVLGFKKSGANYRWFNAGRDYGKIINFQRSVLNSNPHITKFTINVGLYVPRFTWRALVFGIYENPSVWHCYNQRIGFLLGSPIDIWYELPGEGDANPVYETVAHDIDTAVIPYLCRLGSREAAFGQIAKDMEIVSSRLASASSSPLYRQ